MKGSGIRDVHPVQEGEEIHDADEGEDVPVDAGHELPFGGVRGTLDVELIMASVDSTRIIGVAAWEHPLSFLIVETRARCSVGQPELLMFLSPSKLSLSFSATRMHSLLNAHDRGHDSPRDKGRQGSLSERTRMFNISHLLANLPAQGLNPDQLRTQQCGSKGRQTETTSRER